MRESDEKEGAKPEAADGEQASWPWAGRRLWLRPAVRYDVLADGRTVVWLGGARQVIGGRSARIVPPLLELVRSGALAEELVASLCRDGAFEEREVLGVLAALWARGLLDEAELDGAGPLDGPPLDGIARGEAQADGNGASARASELAAQLRFLSLFTGRPREAAARIAAARVRVVAFGALARRLEARLGESGVAGAGVLAERAVPPAEAAQEAGPGWAWTVLGGRSFEESWMLAWNDALVARRERFLCCSVQGGVAVIGPTVLPGESACLRCAVEAERRLRASRRAEPPVPAVAPSPCEPVALLDLAADLVALELVKELTGAFGSPLAGRRLVVEPVGSRFEARSVLKLPRCASCGRPATRAEVEAFPAPRPAARPAGAAGEADDAA